MIAARRGTILKTLLATVLATLLITLILPKTYTASSDVFIDYKGSDPIGGRLFSPILDESYMQTQLDMLRSYAVADKVIDKLDLTQTPAYRAMVAKQGEARAHANLIKEIGDRTLVVTRRSSRVIELEYSAPTPTQARDFANSVVRAYIELNQQIAFTAARSRREQYNAQLENLRKEADTIQQAMTRYQQQTGLLINSERDDLQTRQLADLVNALNGVKAERREAAARKQNIDNLLRSGVHPNELPDIAQRPNIADLKSKISDVDRRLAEVRNVLGPNHPRTLSLIQERNALLVREDREARSMLDLVQLDTARLDLQEASLQREIDAQNAKLSEQKGYRDTILSYQRRLDSVERVYNSALTKYDDLLMASNINTPDLAVLRVAEAPTRAAKPLLLQNLAASVVVGLVLGLGLALLLEFSRRRVRSQDDVIKGVHLPLIGRIGTR